MEPSCAFIPARAPALSRLGVTPRGRGAVILLPPGSFLVRAFSFRGKAAAPSYTNEPLRRAFGPEPFDVRLLSAPPARAPGGSLRCTLGPRGLEICAALGADESFLVLEFFFSPDAGESPLPLVDGACPGFLLDPEAPFPFVVRAPGAEAAAVRLLPAKVYPLSFPRAGSFPLPLPAGSAVCFDESPLPPGFGLGGVAWEALFDGELSAPEEGLAPWLGEDPAGAFADSWGRRWTAAEPEPEALSLLWGGDPDGRFGEAYAGPRREAAAARLRLPPGFPEGPAAEAARASARLLRRASPGAPGAPADAFALRGAGACAIRPENFVDAFLGDAAWTFVPVPTPPRLPLQGLRFALILSLSGAVVEALGTGGASRAFCALLASMEESLARNASLRSEVARLARYPRSAALFLGRLSLRPVFPWHLFAPWLFPPEAFGLRRRPLEPPPPAQAFLAAASVRAPPSPGGGPRRISLELGPLPPALGGALRASFEVRFASPASLRGASLAAGGRCAFLPGAAFFDFPEALLRRTSFPFPPKDSGRPRRGRPPCPPPREGPAANEFEFSLTALSGAPSITVLLEFDVISLLAPSGVRSAPLPEVRFEAGEWFAPPNSTGLDGAARAGGGGQAAVEGAAAGPGGARRARRRLP